MSRLLSITAPSIRSRVVIFTVLTVLFTLLHCIGSALFQLAGGLITVKPYGGVALALILIMGESWLWPVLAAGTLGCVLGKLAFAAALNDLLVTPTITALTLFTLYRAVRRLIGSRVDFHAWRQLVGFILLSALLSCLSASLFTLVMHGWSSRPGTTWQAWFISTALSYVIFTPVLVLLATAEQRVFGGNWRKLSGCLLLLTAVLAVNFLPTRLPLLFTTPMALLIITLIAGLEGAALGLVVTQLFLTGAAALGFAPSTIAYLPLGYQLYFIQIFMAMLIAVMLPVAAAIAERSRLRDSMVHALAREAQVNAALRGSEQHAREMAAKAQAASNAKSEFLASMSHELRTPLNAILGFSEILKAQLYGPLGHPKYLEYSEYVHKSGAHLLDLINDVLDLSKIDAGKMELRESSFSVRELVEDTVHLVRGRAGHVSIHIVMDQDIEALADKRLIKQILLNLLSNAIKFTQAGSVTVAAREETRGGLEISVTDTGIGMDESQLKKAFSQYGQIDSRIARTHQGTGLGLPISLGLARLHGGDLTAASKPGAGTCMTLTLPENRVIRAEPQAAFALG